ncbi:hypothetical protein B0T17DRAFT_495299 [Bombardia bombarda]|uniref:DUF8004 domain-containing protein n=1 Tax=Bombardia bombarda TaxID=252184 RepID=A0AA40BYH7_9PEZI|nr:hypothetical protein B0T17DRAFT_495299 [Bombardia bombarda]
MLRKAQRAPPVPTSEPPPPPVPQKETRLHQGPSITALQASPVAERKSRDKRRSVSASRLSPNSRPHSNRLQARQPSPSPAPRGRSTSAQPPKARVISAEAPRIVSTPVDLRPHSKHSSDGGARSHSRGSDKEKHKRTWLPGGRSRSNSIELGKKTGTGAWIMSPDSTVDYSTASLVNGDKVPELWNESGNVYVYLHPKESGRGPSFKVSDFVFSSSTVLNELLLSEIIMTSTRGAHLSADDVTRRQYPPLNSGMNPVDGHLYLPLGNPDLDGLIAARNLFAFLTNQPLVGTKTNPTLFKVLLQIAGLLRQFGFNSLDGSSFGGSVDAAFDLFLDQFNLADVRQSREKTLEALVLAEQMKSWNLYNEAFSHAVGKYEELLDLKSPLFSTCISVSTRNRLERAHLDLTNRQANLNHRLESFEFPSLFAGIASSTSRDEYKNVKFKEWKTSFSKMRAFVLGYYKDQFGNWPPKARSKKNRFSQSGLNRQCLKILYSDLCALYDLLVDRESLTTRVIDQVEDVEENPVNPEISALRKMLSEFDHSSPPVLPPIPFDVPKIPSMTTIHENYHELSAKRQASYDKTLQSNELFLVLIKSRNIDIDQMQIPFLQAFKEFELKETKGVNPQDLGNQRIGYWLFLYAVLQSLPMLVVDAPGLNWTEGVEYFLCEPPQGNPPWTEDAGEVRKMWYQTAGQGIVELSADVIMFSVEGIYMRSHCWLAAKQWGESVGGGGATAAASAPSLESGGVASPLEPPRAVFQDMDPMSNNSRPASSAGGSSAPSSPNLRPRNSSPQAVGRAGTAYRSSIAIGLEPLPLTEGVPGGGGDARGRATSNVGPVSYHQQPQQPQQHPHQHPQGIRGRSFGNAGQMMAGGNMEQTGANRSPPPGQGAGHGRSGSTFDDILKGMETEKAKTKKRSFF